MIAKLEERGFGEHTQDAGMLLDLAQQFLTSAGPFKPLDLVEWKPGLKNKRLPEYGEPAVVIEVLDAAIVDDGKDSGSSYFREPLDITLGLVDEDDELVVYHYDSRRLRPFRPPLPQSLDDRQ